MDNMKILTALTGVIEGLLLSGDYPGLEDLTSVRRDRNGDLLVDFASSEGTRTVRIQLTTVRWFRAARAYVEEFEVQRSTKKG